MTNIIERIRAEGLVFRDKAVGGLIISVTGTRSLAVTAGTIWSNLNEVDMPALDTNVSGTFSYMWYSSTGGWQSSAVSQYSVLNYNVVTQAALQALTANRYANLWVYACPCSQTYAVLYPQNQYANAASAEAEATPTTIPLTLRENGILIGRITIQQNNNTVIETSSAFDTQFTPALAADHGNLAGLSDDDHTQYLLASGTRALTGNWATSANNELYIDIAGRKVGIGTNAPTQPLHVYNATADLDLRIETDKVNGVAQAVFVNDAQTWNFGVNANDYFQLRDATAGNNVVIIRNGAPANSFVIKGDGSVEPGAAIAWTGIITPSQITANQNDYNPTNLSTASSFI